MMVPTLPVAILAEGWVMDDHYAPATGTALCPHCDCLAFVPRFFEEHDALQQALLDLICPLGHCWHEVRTRTSCDRFWEPAGWGGALVPADPIDARPRLDCPVVRLGR